MCLNLTPNERKVVVEKGEQFLGQLKNELAIWDKATSFQDQTMKLELHYKMHKEDPSKNSGVIDTEYLPFDVVRAAAINGLKLRIEGLEKTIAAL